MNRPLSQPSPRSSTLRCLAACLLTALLPVLHAALPPAQLGEAVKAHQDSVLYFGGTLKYLCGRCTQEHQYPIMSSAVVVDTKGVFLAGTLGPLLDPKSEIRSSTLHVRMADGTEVPVGIALKDEELGVLVLTLEKPDATPSRTLKSLNLDGAPRAKFLEELVVVRRHDAMAGFSASGSAIRVDALQLKPRTTYLSSGLSSNQGIAPCFDTQGRLVALAIGAMQAVAPDEVSDLVTQASKKTAK